jgi:hypothetical protein
MKKIYYVTDGDGKENEVHNLRSLNDIVYDYESYLINQEKETILLLEDFIKSSHLTYNYSVYLKDQSIVSSRREKNEMNCLE